MKRKIKTIELECSSCGIKFQKELKEYKRRIKNNVESKFYCNIDCRNKSSQTDEYSPFRTFLFNAKKNSRTKKLQFNLDLIYLKSLWEKQNGVCKFSNVSMILFPTTNTKKYVPDAASLDRIDSNKGYIKGNVQYVCLAINYAKNTFDTEEFVLFLQKMKINCK